MNSNKKFHLQLENEAVVGAVLKGIAKFKNPLPIALTNGIFVIQGPGLEEKLEYLLPNVLEVGAESTFQFSMTPQYEETTLVIANFHAKELSGAYGSAMVTVTNKA